MERILKKRFSEKYDTAKDNYDEAFKYAFDGGIKEADELQQSKLEPLIHEYERKQIRLQQAAESFSRFSPASNMVFAVSRLSQTDACILCLTNIVIAWKHR